MGQHADIEAYLARLAAVPPVSEAEAQAILELARDVAHRTERRFAPVAAYAAGLAAAEAEPGSRVDVVRRAIEAVNSGNDG